MALCSGADADFVECETDIIWGGPLKGKDYINVYVKLGTKMNAYLEQKYMEED